MDTCQRQAFQSRLVCGLNGSVSLPVWQRIAYGSARLLFRNGIATSNTKECCIAGSIVLHLNLHSRQLPRMTRPFFARPPLTAMRCSNVTPAAICPNRKPVLPLTIIVWNVMAGKCPVYMELFRRAGEGRQGTLFQYQIIPTYQIR